MSIHPHASPLLRDVKRISRVIFYFMTLKPIYQKPHISTAEQLKHLTTKGLRVDDAVKAEKFLQRVSYYRFKGYALSFRHLTLPDKPFKSGVCFDDIARMMRLDENLRLVLLAGLQVIEIAIRTQLNEILTQRYGIRWYADPLNFRVIAPRARGSKPPFDHAEFLTRCKKEFIRSSSELFVNHYRNTYDDSHAAPSWMLVETMTLGTWSSAYNYLKDNLARDELADFYGVHRDVLTSWLHSLTVLRNICAHHGRIWDRELAVQPKIPHSVASPYPFLSNSRLGPLLFVMNQMLRKIDPDLRWVNQLKVFLNHYWPDELQYLGLEKRWYSHPSMQP